MFGSAEREHRLKGGWGETLLGLCAKPGHENGMPFRAFLWKTEGASSLGVLIVVAQVDILILVVKEGVLKEQQ